MANRAVVEFQFTDTGAGKEPTSGGGGAAPSGGESRRDTKNPRVAREKGAAENARAEKNQKQMQEPRRSPGRELPAAIGGLSRPLVGALGAVASGALVTSAVKGRIAAAASYSPQVALARAQNQALDILSAIQLAEDSGEGLAAIERAKGALRRGFQRQVIDPIARGVAEGGNVLDDIITGGFGISKSDVREKLEETSGIGGITAAFGTGAGAGTVVAPGIGTLVGGLTGVGAWLTSRAVLDAWSEDADRQLNFLFNIGPHMEPAEGPFSSNSGVRIQTSEPAVFLL